MSYEGRTFEKIKDIAMSRDISVIGIDGLGGAGKSTVSESVCSYLENSGIHTILLHIDDFIHVREVLVRDALASSLLSFVGFFQFVLGVNVVRAFHLCTVIGSDKPKTGTN